ncbi:MAG TPA: hypothetical protein VIJ68_02660 [Candidatus Saccharimonadales bacterium]
MPNPRLDQLELLIEGFRACPPLPEEILTLVGGLALDGTTTGTPQINSNQFAVVERASQGDDTAQAAENLGWKETEVIKVRKQLLALYRVPQMSGVIDKVIRDGTLSFTAEEGPYKPLSRQVDLVLEAFCVGMPNTMISRALGQSRKQFGDNSHLQVRKRTGADGRTNAVLQAYRRRYRQLPS